MFIDQWKQAIDASEKIFTGLTLVISPDLGNDLPEFRNNPIRTIHPDNILFAQDCKDAIAAAAAPLPTDTDFRSCEAKTEILSYFVTVSGPNAKATQVGGLTASSPKDIGNIGIAGVKLLHIAFSAAVAFDLRAGLNLIFFSSRGLDTDRKKWMS